MQSLFAQFQTRYPSGGLVTELLTIHDGNYVVRALVNVGDRAIATGMAAAPTVEAAEDQARLRALQVFNQLSNPIALTESPTLTPQFLPTGLPLQPNMPIPAAANVSVSPNLNAATNASISAPLNAAANTATSSPHPIQSPVVPTPINGATGMASTPSTVTAQPVASSASQATKAKNAINPSSSSAASVPDTSDWSVDLSAAPDSTLPTNFSITSVSAKTSPKPVADLYAAATEASEENVVQPWEASSTSDLDQPQSSISTMQNDPVQNDDVQNDTASDDHQAIPFFGDDPLEPEFPAEDFASPMEDEAAVSAKSTKAKPAKSAKSTKTSSSKASANSAPASQVIDRSDEIAQIDVEMRRLGWSKQDGRQHLEQTYNKRSRQQLTDDELLAFLAYLQAQPSPSQSPF